MFARKTSRYIDTRNRFPRFIASWQQEQEMELLCADELTAWREAVAYHYALPTVDAKLHNRRRLSASFNRLKSAWETVASAPVESLCVAS